MRSVKYGIIGILAGLGVGFSASAQSVSDDVNVSLTLEVPNTMAFSVMGDVSLTFNPDTQFGQFGDNVDACIFTNSDRVTATFTSLHSPSGAKYQYVKDSGEGRLVYYVLLDGLFDGGSYRLATKPSNGVPVEFGMSNASYGDLPTSDETCSEGANLSVGLVFNPIISDMDSGTGLYRTVDEYIAGEGASGTVVMSDTLTITVEPVLGAG